jgi:hypothetical protein
MSVTIADIAFLGTQIVGFKANRPPNPGCCADAGILCARCAFAALEAQGHTQNQEFKNNVLPVPDFDWSEPLEQEQQTVTKNLVGADAPLNPHMEF